MACNHFGYIYCCHSSNRNSPLNALYTNNRWNQKWGAGGTEKRNIHSKLSSAKYWLRVQNKSPETLSLTRNEPNLL